MPRRKSRNTARTPHLDPTKTKQTIKMLENSGLNIAAFALKKSLKEQKKKKRR